MQRTFTALGLAGIVGTLLVYAAIVVRREERRGNHMTFKNGVLAFFVITATFGGAAFVVWLMLNPSR